MRQSLAGPKLTGAFSCVVSGGLQRHHCPGRRQPSLGLAGKCSERFGACRKGCQNPPQTVAT
eukprot:11941293-Alexandrium_andersonii.AAC.1